MTCSREKKSQRVANDRAMRLVTAGSSYRNFMPVLICSVVEFARR